MAGMKKKRIWITLAILLAAVALPVTALAEKSSMDVSGVNNGYLTIYYAPDNDAAFRVSIQMHGSEQLHAYTGGSRAKIQLPGSSGQIKAILYEQVSGNTYKKIEERTFQKTAVTDLSEVLLQSSTTIAPVLYVHDISEATDVAAGESAASILDAPMGAGSGGTWSSNRTVPPEYQKYLASTSEITFSAGDAVSQKAAELIAGKPTTEAQVMAIYSFIITNFEYDWDFYYAVKSGRITSYTPDPNTALAKRKGVCYDIASLFAAMARSVGIPTKMVKGNAVPANGYHAWNSIYEFESLSWVDLDATLNLGGKGTSLYKALGRGYTASSEH